MFFKLSKNTVNVSHKIFHNPANARFYEDLSPLGRPHPAATVSFTIYSNVTMGFCGDAENRIAPSILTAVINFDPKCAKSRRSLGYFADENEALTKIVSPQYFKSAAALAVALPEVATSPQAAQKLRAPQFLQSGMAA